ncbi:transposase [Breoghania sp. L-A4]|nr:transposase [Breoghania sp. L-A4]
MELHVGDRSKYGTSTSLPLFPEAAIPLTAPIRPFVRPAANDRFPPFVGVCSVRNERQHCRLDRAPTNGRCGGAKRSLIEWLCEEVHLNLGNRWFHRLDLNNPTPDHSTISKNRHGRFHNSDLLEHVFKTVVAR